MYKRRRQAASPVSLLVVTLLSVWACSSGGHGVSSVTTSGGAGSSLGLGSASSASSPGVSASGEGGASGSESVASSDAAGAAGESQSPGPQPAAGGGSGGAAGAVDLLSNTEAGAAGVSFSVGGASGGVSSSAGSGGGGAAGAPFVAPVCAPTGASTTDASATLYLPCDVNSALFVCRTCHTNPPTKPTSTSYVTYADFKNRAAAVYDVVRTGYMPRPPYHMSVAQQQTALKWLGQDGSCAIGVPTPCQ